MHGSTQDVDSGLAGHIPDDATLLDALRSIDTSVHFDRQMPPLLFFSYDVATTRFGLRSVSGPVVGRQPGATIRLIEHCRSRLDAGDANVVQELGPGFLGVILIGRDVDDHERPFTFATLALADGTLYWVRQDGNGEVTTEKVPATQRKQQRLTAMLRDLAVAAARCATPSFVSNDPSRTQGGRGDMTPNQHFHSTAVSRHEQSAASLDGRQDD